MKILETNRLILRDLSLDDLEAFNAYAKKQNIGPMAGWLPHQSIEESHLILRMMIDDQDVWGITLRGSDRLIGTIGLHVRNFDNALKNQKEIGYVLDEPYWGQGLMQEAVCAVLDYAFMDESLDRVLCGHSLMNAQSKRVIEKVNFQFCYKEMREDHLKNPIEISVYQMRRDDYLRRMEHEPVKTKI